jgi:hypothetical protein
MRQLVKLLREIQSNPSLLTKEVDPATKRTLTAGRAKRMNVNNSATVQEINFAELLDSHKIAYAFQPNGTQRAPDFTLSESKLDIDLKHTKGMSLMLNDGWFLEETLYVISYHKDRVFIGLGRDISSPEEREAVEELFRLRKELNVKYKGVDCLGVTFRFANSYHCRRFDDETTRRCLDLVEESLEEAK